MFGVQALSVFRGLVGCFGALQDFLSAVSSPPPFLIVIKDWHESAAFPLLSKTKLPLLDLRPFTLRMLPAHSLFRDRRV